MAALPLSALLAALLACAPAARAQEEARGQRLADLRAALEHGDWNGRMHAVRELAPFDADGLPLLVFAADDADWQVRLSAVHQLGRVGAPAISALAQVLKQEPCRAVRISAIHWLGSMGEAAAPVLERALDDESRMLRMEDRYWLDKLGRSPSRGGEDVRDETSLAAREDLRLCAAAPSRLGGERPSSRAKALAAEISVSKIRSDNPSTTPATAPPDAPDYIQTLADARKLAADAIPDGPPIPPSRPPEVLPPGPPLPQREEPSSEAKLLALAARAKPDPALDALRTAGRRETLPPGAAGLEPRQERRPEPRLEADAGAPKAAADPLPVLLAQLRSGDERARARAADELGKRGAAAAPALPALRKALRDRRPRVRASAALALGNLDDAQAVADLSRAARDKSEDVRWSAVVALGRIHAPAARAAFRQALQRRAGVVLTRQDFY